MVREQERLQQRRHLIFPFGVLAKVVVPNDVVHAPVGKGRLVEVTDGMRTIRMLSRFGKLWLSRFFVPENVPSGKLELRQVLRGFVVSGLVEFILWFSISKEDVLVRVV